MTHVRRITDAWGGMIAYFPANIEGEAGADSVSRDAEPRNVFEDKPNLSATFWLSNESPLGVHRERQDRAQDADDDAPLRSSRRRSPTPSPKSRDLMGVHRELRNRAEDADDHAPLRSSRRRSPTPSPKSRDPTPRPSSGSRRESSKCEFESIQRCALEVLCRAQALSEEDAHKAKQVRLEVILPF
jgi:hypothetical protein